MTLGLQFPHVRLATYTPAWAEEFAAERERIVPVWQGELRGIEHVGSTAIPGISAKPIIDIAVAVSDLQLADRFSPGMASIGYEDAGDGGVPGQRIFGKGRRLRTHLVHVVVSGSRDWHNYLTFREALLADKALADEYDSLKRLLASNFPDDRSRYTSAKGKFIERVLSQAAGS